MSVTSYTSPSYDEAPRPLTDDEKRLLKRMFSDYFEVPSEWKAELKADLERDPPILGQATLGVGIGAASALPLEKLAATGYIGTTYMFSGGIGFNYPTGPSIRAVGTNRLDFWADEIRIGAAFQDIAIRRFAATQIGLMTDMIRFGAYGDAAIERAGPEDIALYSQRLVLGKAAGINETPLVVNVGGVNRNVLVGPNNSAGGIGRTLYVANY